MPQNIKKSKDDKNQMQRRLSNEITKSIKLCDFLLILLSGGELGSPPQELEFHGPVGPGNSSPLNSQSGHYFGLNSPIPLINQDFCQAQTPTST